MRTLATMMVVSALVGLGAACDPREAYYDEMQEMNEDRERGLEALQEEESELRRERQHIRKEGAEAARDEPDEAQEERNEEVETGTLSD